MANKMKTTREKLEAELQKVDKLHKQRKAYYEEQPIYWKDTEDGGLYLEQTEKLDEAYADLEGVIITLNEFLAFDY
ncbi:MAG: hypothetical protein ACRBFS_07975 [Aureispira sp.]